MTAKRILKAYGLWLGGVLTAALAAWLLYRSGSIEYGGDDWELPEADVLPAAEPIYADSPEYPEG